MKKGKIFFLLIFLLFISIFSSLLKEYYNPDHFALASEGRSLEINYPQVRGYSPGRTSDPINKYVEYIFNFAIWGVGALVLITLIIAGTQYLVSVENPEGKKEAKDKITSALTGMIILISSVIILNQIDEDLIRLPLPQAEKPIVLGPGIWLCSESIPNFEPFMKGELVLEKKEREEKTKEIREKCYKLTLPSREPRGFEIKEAYIINYEDLKTETESPFRYAVVFHETDSYLGKCLFTDKSKNVESFDPDSMTPLKLTKEAEGEGVTVYSHRQLNEYVDEEDDDVKSENYSGSGSGYSSTGNIENPDMNPCYSIGIDEPKNWIAITYKDNISNPQEEVWCEVFDRTDNDLMDNFTGQFCGDYVTWERVPCVISLLVLKGQIINEDRN